MPNRLAQETSPYLQQHADNPVDWYAWGPEALEESKRSGKPILLSIGYSACHWCHVMAHESFEDATIAKVMNDLFVNVKVDREERPDIDQIYQVAQHLLTQRQGGWPLTMFLTPEQMPFFGGTYFPDKPRHGLPGFPELLRKVREFYDQHRADIASQGGELTQMLARMQPVKPSTAPRFNDDPADMAADYLRQSFDEVHGGFTGAPKFPHPDMIEFLLRHRAATGDAESLRMATFTLRKMALGGLYDQVGGGFARYSVDAQWAIPHFEKMLYDNGWLMRLYADAYAATGDPLFERVCVETAQWVMREMQSPEGGYYSSLDADSEGEEGKFYVWTVDEVRALLSQEEFEVASLVYGLDRPPNFEEHAWHFVVARTVQEAARMLETNEGAVQGLLDGARAKLRDAREKRVRPGRDDKILASWNALMIGGMARASRVFGHPEWLESARRALEFVRIAMWNGGRLRATYKDGKAHLDAYLDDYAYLLAALLEAMQAEFDPADLAWAREIGDALLERFHDPKDGGFFFTAHDHEKLIQRTKAGPDNATPSGGAVAALALHRLAFLTGDLRYSEAAASAVALFWPQLERQPIAFGTLLGALNEQVTPPRTLIVTGAREGFGPWRKLLDAAYMPTTLTLFIPSGTQGLPAPLDKPAKDEVAAWLCEGATCRLPIADPEALRDALELPRIAASH